ncbi:glycosyltransferase [Winogradskyella litoriviva]|uniref:Glycosyltransferase n=1 Tax=Winogradskyella litoriviva TaxID=1220182 RepID=A0ABX2E4W4_9FLAO|nr:glycosyltransferase [Winogradskyella litoriviva]NRD23521.1 glycosyltransferase [Winogradskyella litoriviva]
MNKKTKICFVLPSLKAGGAERVMTYIAQNIDKSKFEPFMVIFGFEKDVVYNTEGIRIIYLNKTKITQGIFTIINVFKNEKPNIVICSIGHVNSLLALVSPLFKKIKFIGREANVGSVRNKMNSKNNTIFSIIHKKSLKVLDVIICQSNDMLKDIISENNIDTNRLITINNPITKGFTLKDRKKQNSIVKYITVGALHERKGHKRLLNLLSKLDHDFRYTIIGNGSKLNEITEQINKLNLSDKVIHIPYTKEVPKYLRESDVFLNGSFVEGFPNVMIESCATGTPVITFAAPGGIDEIIQNGINGYIVDNETDFINYLNKNNKTKLFDSKTINLSVTSRYSSEIILSKYECLFDNLMNNRPIK